MMRYATVVRCRVSVFRIGVHDPGRAKRSRRCCTISAFRRILISPTSRGHLTLAMASRGAARGEGVSGCSIYPWSYK